MKTIKDFIYFDYEKAKSLQSQLGGGLLNEITRAFESESGGNSELGFDLKIVSAKTGLNDREKTVRTEKLEIYHELLNDIESKLFESNTLKELNTEFDSTFNNFLEKVPKYTYVKATGWCTFEDYKRFTNVLENFNEIQRLIFGSAHENNPEILNLKKEIDGKKKSLKRAHNQKEINQLKVTEKKFDEIIQQLSGTNLLDETFVERIKVFMSTFNPNRLNFKLMPFDDFPEFQIMSNLKNEFLVNGSFENVIYTYGSRPNIKLTIFGIITSCPQLIDERVKPSDEFNYVDETELSVEKVYEKAFGGVFNAIQGLEKFFEVYYPKVSVSPIGIYREIVI